MSFFKIISNRILPLLFLLLNFGCNKEPIVRGLEDTTLYLDVYKTRNDYFQNVNIWGGDVAFPSTLSSADTGRIRITETDTTYLLRWRLIDGYVMDLVMTIDDYFTDMTFSELIALNGTCAGCLSMKEMRKRVIDRDPFLEYYVDRDNLFRIRDSTAISRLNEIIAAGELEKYLHRTK